MFNLDMLCNLYVTKIGTVLTADFPAKCTSDITRNNNYGIAFGISGEVEFTHNGNKYICGKNDVALIPGYSNYTYTAPRGAKIAIINFELDPETDEFSDFNIASVDNIESFLADHAALCKIYTSASLTRNTEFLSVFYKMITRLINTIGVNQDDSSTWHITEYISANISSPDLSVPQIAQAAGFSEVHFRKLFKNCYGVSPRQYVQNLRIETAKKLLESNNDSISKIATQCGFSTIFYFSKLFKDKTGYSPYEYRERYRKLF